MEYINDYNKNKNGKLLLKKCILNPKIQMNERIITDSDMITSKLSFPITTESLAIIPKCLNNVNNNNLSKNTEKSKKKGSLHKYINSSYFKKSLGSIPCKTEKILLNGKKNIDRFSGSNSLFNHLEENIPGVGSYDLNYDWNLKNKSVKISTEEKRFSDFYNFLPGVGQYDLDNGQKEQQKKDNLRYNSLYSRTKTYLNDNINKNSNKNSFCYDPKNLNDIMINKKNFNFCSYSGRNSYRGSKIPTFFDKVSDQPGPGYYFINSNNNLKKKDSYYSIRKNVSFEKDKSKNIRQFLDNYLSDINVKEDEPSFCLKQNGNKRENKFYHLEDIYKLNRSYKKKVFNEKEELEKKLRENEKSGSSKNLYFKIRENMELDKIKTILGNDNGKPDFFYLSPERWKTKKNIFKTPGPAYYFY